MNKLKELVIAFTGPITVIVAVVAAMTFSGQSDVFRRAKIEVSDYIDADVYKQDGVTYDLSTMGGGGGSKHTIEDEGTPLTSRAALNFEGAGVTVADDSGEDATVVTIPGDAVSSVNSQTGAVSLDADDISDSGTTNKWNQTHTGDVTGATSLTIASGAVDLGMLSATGTPDNTKYLRGDNTWATPAGSGTVTSVAVSGTDGLQVDSGSPITESGTIQLGVDAAGLRSHINVENGATADQTDSEIETAYNNQVSVVSQAEAEAGTATTARRWTAQRVGQAIAALGGGDPTYGSNAGASDNAVYMDADNQMGLGTTTPSSSIHLYDDTLPPSIAYQFFSESGGDVTAYPATKTYSTPGSQIWTGETNIGANDATYAGSIAFGATTTQTLKGTNFSFSLPAGATVDGIEVDVDVKCNNAFGLDYGAYLIIGGTVQTGTNKAVGTALNTSDTVITYGGPLDDWGGVTRDQVNASDFGFAWRGEFTAGATISVDYITITVYYTELGGDHHWTTGLSLASGAFVFRENATDHVSIAKNTGDTTFGGIVDADGYKQDGVLYDLSALGGGVTGPGTSTDRAIPTWNGTGGGALRDTTVGIDVNGNLTLASGDTVDGRDVSVDGAKLDGIAPGATANTGTVTSVVVSGSDGIDVDSGSPITTNGTIALGLNASTLYAHLVSTASTVTGASGDTLLISDSSAAGALAEIAITDLILAGSSTDNRIPKRNGTAGQLEDSGISIDDSNNVSGMGTLNSHAIPSGTGALVSTDATQTLTGKDVVPRELTDSSTPVDVNATDYDTVVTVLSANTTFNAPSSPPRNGKRLFYMIQQAAAGGPYTSTWNGVFRSPDSWGLSNAIPAVSTTAGTWDYFLFIWNDATDTWDLLATSAPL